MADEQQSGQPDDLSWMLGFDARRRRREAAQLGWMNDGSEAEAALIGAEHRRRQAFIAAISSQGATTPILPPENVGPPILLQSVVEPLAKTDDGQIVRVALLPWQAILDEVARDPAFLNSLDWRKLEELVAASYDAAGFDEVILTPRSGDGGRDVIAVKFGLVRIRILDQVKANKSTNLVTPDDVRAMLGVLSSEPNTSKGFVTTTSDFAPSIATDPAIQQFVPYRLDLRNGQKLAEWLIQHR